MKFSLPCYNRHTDLGKWLQLVPVDIAASQHPDDVGGSPVVTLRINGRKHVMLTRIHPETETYYCNLYPALSDE